MAIESTCVNTGWDGEETPEITHTYEIRKRFRSESTSSYRRVRWKLNGWGTDAGSEIAEEWAEKDSSHVSIPHLPIPPDLQSMTRQRLKDIATLSRRKGRRAHGQFLVEGVRSVEAAVFAEAPLVEILVAHEIANEARVAALVEAAHVPVHGVAARDLERVGDARTSQGVLAVARSIVHRQLDVKGPVVVLDGIQDPGNVGALVRSAAWFGVAAVVADARSADFEGPKAVRASMGGLWDLQLVRAPELAPALDAILEAGRVLWGADMRGTAISSWRPSGTDVLVLGNEGNGLSETVAARLSGRVSIPGADGTRGVESLNVGVAAGVILHQWLG